MRTIYLDYNATTPIAPQVQEAMLPFLAEHYGNPSSSHALGRAAREAINDARHRVASLIGAQTDEIVFTACGTESNNLAIKGTAFQRAFDGGDFAPRGHLIISRIEHPATVKPAAFLQRLGWDVTHLGVDSQGLVSPTEVAAAIRPDTILVSIMHANNETGAIQPIREIAEICHRNDVLIHTDAAQSTGKIPVDVRSLDVNMLTIAGHKIYAPKGIGALYVRQGVLLESVQHGASHEHGLRAGTENVPYIVGLGAAAEVARLSLEETESQMQAMRDRLADRIRQGLSEPVTINSEDAPRLPNTLNINFPGVAGVDLLRLAPDLCASTGAACHSDTTELSATLAAMGVADSVGRGSIRLSVGRFTDEEEIDRAADMLIAAWESLRS